MGQLSNRGQHFELQPVSGGLQIIRQIQPPSSRYAASSSMPPNMSQLPIDDNFLFQISKRALDPTISTRRRQDNMISGRKQGVNSVATGRSTKLSHGNRDSQGGDQASVLKKELQKQSIAGGNKKSPPQLRKPSIHLDEIVRQGDSIMSPGTALLDRSPSPLVRRFVKQVVSPSPVKQQVVSPSPSTGNGQFFVSHKPSSEFPMGNHLMNPQISCTADYNDPTTGSIQSKMQQHQLFAAGGADFSNQIM